MYIRVQSKRDERERERESWRSHPLTSSADCCCIFDDLVQTEKRERVARTPELAAPMALRALARKEMERMKKDARARMDEMLLVSLSLSLSLCKEQKRRD